MIAAKPILCASQRRSPGQDPAFRQILFRKSRPGRTPLGIDADAGGSDRLTKNANQLFSHSQIMSSAPKASVLAQAVRNRNARWISKKSAER